MKYQAQQKAAYLVRFDDACPTAKWETWDAAAAILDEFRIKPIVAVIPDNRDPQLEYGPAVTDFWSRVKRWQDRGWTVAMHGYQHVFSTDHPGIVGLNRYSEFAGVSYREQAAKLQAGYDLLSGHGIEPTAFIAPAHSFDSNTLRALGHDLPRKLMISDGLFRLPYRDAFGLLRMPQQIWRFRPMPPGIWTVCFHPSEWKPEYLRRFREEIERFHERIADCREVAHVYSERKASAGDHVFAAIWKQAVLWKTGCKRRRPADFLDSAKRPASLDVVNR